MEVAVVEFTVISGGSGTVYTCTSYGIVAIGTYYDSHKPTVISAGTLSLGRSDDDVATMDMV